MDVSHFSDVSDPEDGEADDEKAPTLERHNSPLISEQTASFTPKPTLPSVPLVETSSTSQDDRKAMEKPMKVTFNHIT